MRRATWRNRSRTGGGQQAILLPRKFLYLIAVDPAATTPPCLRTGRSAMESNLLRLIGAHQLQL